MDLIHTEFRTDDYLPGRQRKGHAVGKGYTGVYTVLFVYFLKLGDKYMNVYYLYNFKQPFFKTKRTLVEGDTIFPCKKWQQ